MSDFKHLYDLLRARAEQVSSSKFTLEEFARQVGMPFDGSSAALTRLREIDKRGTIASLHGRLRPEGIIVHEPQRYALGVDLASGPDRTVVTTMRREGMTYVLDDEVNLPPTEARPWFTCIPAGTRLTPCRDAASGVRARYITPQLMRLAGLRVSVDLRESVREGDVFEHREDGGLCRIADATPRGVRGWYAAEMLDGRFSYPTPEELAKHWSRVARDVSDEAFRAVKVYMRTVPRIVDVMSSRGSPTPAAPSRR